MSTIRFGPDGRSLRLMGEPADIRWLAWFLGPWFEQAPVDEGHVLGSRRGRSPDPPPGGRRPLPAFTLERGVISLPGTDVDGQVTLHDDAVGARYEHEPARTEVLAEPGDLRSRLGLARVARELSWASVEADDRVALHAAAFELDGRAFLLGGPRRAGKTTVLLAALVQLGARLVANDCLSLRLGPDGPVVRGVPTVVRVRPGTRQVLPDAAERLVDTTSFVCLPDEPSPQRPPGDDLHLAPADLARRLDRSTCAEAPVAAVLLLDPAASDVGGCRVTPFAAGDAAAALDATRYGRDASDRPPTTFSGPRLAAPSPSSLLGATPVARVGLPPAALGDERALRELLDAVSGAIAP